MIFVPCDIPIARLAGARFFAVTCLDAFAILRHGHLCPKDVEGWHRYRMGWCFVVIAMVRTHLEVATGNANPLQAPGRTVVVHDVGAARTFIPSVHLPSIPTVPTGNAAIGAGIAIRTTTIFTVYQGHGCQKHNAWSRKSTPHS
jgi:hypothetical protein